MNPRDFIQSLTKPKLEEPKTAEEMKAFGRSHFDIAAQSIEEFGSFPFFMYHGYNGRTVDVAPMIFENPEEKRYIFKKVKQFAKRRNASTVVILGEAWAATRSIYEDNQTMPSEDPNRKSLLITVVQSKALGALQISGIIGDDHKITNIEYCDGDNLELMGFPDFFNHRASRKTH